MLRTLLILSIILGSLTGKSQTAICISTTYRGAANVYEDYYLSSDSTLLNDLKRQTDVRISKGAALPKTNYLLFPVTDMTTVLAYTTERRDRMEASGLKYAVEKNASIYTVSIIDATNSGNIVVRNAFREKDDAHAYFDQLIGWITHDHASAAMIAVFKKIMKSVE